MGMGISMSRPAMSVMAQPIKIQAPAVSEPTVPDTSSSAASQSNTVQSLALAKDGHVGTLLDILVK